jgi:hypothetical protein
MLLYKLCLWLYHRFENAHIEDRKLNQMVQFDLSGPNVRFLAEPTRRPSNRDESRLKKAAQHTHMLTIYYYLSFLFNYSKI